MIRWAGSKRLALSLRLWHLQLEVFVWKRMWIDGRQCFCNRLYSPLTSISVCQTEGRRSVCTTLSFSRSAQARTRASHEMCCEEGDRRCCSQADNASCHFGAETVTRESARWGVQLLSSEPAAWVAGWRAEWSRLPRSCQGQYSVWEVSSWHPPHRRYRVPVLAVLATLCTQRSAPLLDIPKLIHWWDQLSKKYKTKETNTEKRI